MTGSETVTRRLVITGRVQGVGFRFAFADEARTRRLGGWVRNRRDGSVEAMVSGSAKDVEAIIGWARHGPPAARVTGVSVDTAVGEFAGFELAPTL
jgi:acylphosphatase